MSAITIPARRRRYLVRHLPHHLTPPTSSSTSVDDEHNELALDTTTTNTITTTTARPHIDVISTSTEHEHFGTSHPSVGFIGEPSASLRVAAGSWQETLNRQRETDGRQIESRLMDSVHHQHHHGAAAEAGSIDVARFSHFLQSALTRTRIGYHSSSSSVSSIHAASAAAGNSAGNHNASYYTTTSSNTSGIDASSNYSRF